MAALDRAYWLSVSACTYVAIAALSSAGPSWIALARALLPPLALLLVWRFAHRREKRADPSVETQALVALRLAAAGVVIWLSSSIGQARLVTLDLAGTLGMGMSAVCAVYALARIPSAPGLLTAPRSTRSVDAAMFTGFLWSVAVAVAGRDVLAPGVGMDPLTLDYAVTAASIGSLLILIATSTRLRFARRLELGVGDRALGALAFSLTALAVAVPVAAMDIGPPDRVLPAFLGLGSLCVIACVVTVDPSFIAMSLRATIVVVALGVPVALLSGSFARATPGQSGSIVLAGSVAAVLVGLIARSAARPLGPEQSRWLMALHDASVAALVPEPQQAIVATLRALQRTSVSPSIRPELWRSDPPSVLSVNVSGTLEVRDAEAPRELYELGVKEPERTLRAEVLKALEVRRPEVRPLLEWFEVHKTFSATIIVDEEGPMGFLALPAADRGDAMTLEEARAARLLADRMSALLAVTSALERARRRQLEAQRTAESWERDYHRLEEMLEGDTRRHRAAAKVLARPLLAAAYSPAVRLLLTELERVGSARSVVFVAPVGTPVEAWAATLHLSLGTTGPLLCIDAGLERSADAIQWTSPDQSILKLCEGGTLFIRDAELLSLQAQQGLLEAFTTRWEAPSRSLPPPRLVLSLSRHPRELLAEGALRSLEPLLTRVVFELPRLAERPEDLRALILDAVSRHARGPEQTPLGVERAALQALLDHSWPGNDAELRDVLARAADVASGPLVTLGDLSLIRFAGVALDAAPPRRSEPAPESEARPEYRPRSRPPRARRRRG